MIELPTGSQVHADAAVADFRGTGELGDCRVTISAGHIQLDRAGAARLSTAAGNVTVDHAGATEVSTGTGRVRIGDVAGTAVVKNSNGNTELGTVTGDVRARAANGDISIDRAAAGVDAKTANGGIRIGEATRGSVVMKTAMGNLDIGIAEGTAAWLNLDTGYGRVSNALAAANEPAQSGDKVEVHARTSFGDITVRRS